MCAKICYNHKIRYKNKKAIITHTDMRLKVYERLLGGEIL